MEKDSQSNEKLEETGSRLEDTVEAITHKTDLPKRANDAITDRIAQVKSTVSDALDSASGIIDNAKSSVGAISDKVRDSLPEKENAQETLRSTGEFARGNALGLAIGAFAVGLIAGSLMPVSRLEQERAQALGDRLAESAVTKANETITQTKAAIGDAFTNARQSSSEQGEEKRRPVDQQAASADDYAGQDGFDEDAARKTASIAAENDTPSIRYGAAV